MFGTVAKNALYVSSESFWTSFFESYATDAAGIVKSRIKSL